MKRWQIWLLNNKELERDFNEYLEEGLIRKIAPVPRLVKIHINKAFHNIDFASFTLKNQEKINKRIQSETYFDWVIIISYYAMYHSALALLYKLGYKTATHLTTICVLCSECLGKSLEKQDIETISRIFELSENEIREIARAKERREKASYSGSISFEKHLAELTLKDGRDFVNKVADILEV